MLKLYVTTALKCQMNDRKPTPSREGNRDKLLGEYTSLDGEIAVFPTIIKPYHEGNLECVAKAQNNSAIQATVSTAHYLEVIGKSWDTLHKFMASL